jgi:hypothetical protein
MGRNGTWMALAAIALAAAGALAGGCGSEDSSTTTVGAAAAGTTPAEAVPADASEMEAVESTIKTWLLQGDCKLMTDHFLEQQTAFADPGKACRKFRAGFSPPASSADEIEVGDITYANEKATATVGEGGGGPSRVGVTSTYKLLLADDGIWRINSAELD